MRTLAADGATADELDRYRRRAARALGDPERTRGQLSYHALGELLDDPVLSDAELERELAELDGAAVAAAMEQVRRSAILLGPQDCPPPGDGLEPLRPRPPEPLTEGDEFTAFSKRKKLTRRSHGGSTLRVSERGVTWEAEEAEPGTILWERCEVVVRMPAGGLVLHQRDGAWMEIPSQGWDDATPFARLEEVIPAGRIGAGLRPGALRRDPARRRALAEARGPGPRAARRACERARLRGGAARAGAPRASG